MADVVKGRENVVACTTTWQLLTWTNAKPDVISVQAVDDTLYITGDTTLAGEAAPGDSYWPIPAGQTHEIPVAQLEGVCIAAASAVDGFVWGS